VTDNPLGSPKPWLLAVGKLAEDQQKLENWDASDWGQCVPLQRNFDWAGQPIYPTPVVGMVGLIPDLTRVCVKLAIKRDLIYLPGSSPLKPDQVTLGCSV